MPPQALSKVRLLNRQKMLSFSLKPILEHCVYLLGTITKSWMAIITRNRQTKRTWVLWFYLSGTRGVLTIKHSIYLGSLSIRRSSFYVASGIDAGISSVQVRPWKFVAARLAPLRSRALTGRVDLSSATLLIAKWRGVNPAWSYFSKKGFIANK